MVMLIIASAVYWGRVGNGQLKTNWHNGRANSDTSITSVARQIYYGICLGMLGLTGFECMFFPTFPIYRESNGEPF